MASHWGTGGVDDKSSIAGAIVTVVVVCVLPAALNTVASLAMSHPRQVRASVVLINFLVVVIAGVIPAVAAGQRGVTEVHDVATPVVPILLTLRSRRSSRRAVGSSSRSGPPRSAGRWVRSPPKTPIPENASIGNARW